MAGGRPPSFGSFTCPNCRALYDVVKAEAGPETIDRQITCPVCGELFPNREDGFILKYVLLRKATRSNSASGRKLATGTTEELAVKSAVAHASASQGEKGGRP